MKRISEMLIAIAAVCLLLLPIGVQALGERAAEDEAAAETGMIEALAPEETPEEEPMSAETEEPAAEAVEPVSAEEAEITAEADVPTEPATDEAEAPAAEETTVAEEIEEEIAEEAVVETADDAAPALDGAALAAPKLVSAECVDVASGTDAADISGRCILVQWEAVSDAAKYWVYYKTDGGSWTRVGSTTDTSMTVKLSQVPNGATYTFTVRGADSDGNKGAYDSGGVSVKYLLATPVLREVAEASASDASGGNVVKLTWEPVVDAEQYRVFRKVGSGSWVGIGVTDGTTFTDDAPPIGTLTYTVRCLSLDGKVYMSAYDTTGLSLVHQLATPKLGGVNKIASGVKLTWSKVTGAEKYRVFRKTDGGSWTKLADVTGTAYTDKKAALNTHYSYTVRCLSADGKSYTSAFDTTGVSITCVDAPALKSVSSAAKGVTVTWGKVTGAEKYRVFRKTGSSSWKKVADTTAASYTDTTAASGTTYDYTVRCLSADGKSYTSAYDTTGKKIAYVAAPVLKSVSNTAKGVTVTWNASAGAEKYRVFRKTGSSSWKKVADTTSVSYTDTKTVSGTTYSYTVRCLSADGKSYTSAFDTTGKSITAK